MGIHHITAIAGDPQKNLDFYAGFLGMRLIKLTVNFDDPSTYHLYYGDETGRPGSILTFFPWPDGRRGRQGTGQAASVALEIPSSSLGFWIERLLAHHIRYEGPARRFDHQVLSFADPDGLLLELVTSLPGTGRPWAEGPIPPAHAIQGLHGTTIWEDRDLGSTSFLEETMELEQAGEDNGLLRYRSPAGGPGSSVYLRRAAGFWRGAGGVGTVHHVAFRAATDEAQLEKRAEIEELGLGITPVIDRQYFHSVYFHEPGGVLFEIATDGPGFTIDESLDELGTHLKLPPMYEASRTRIESVLPPLRLPQAAAPRA
jgi:catechol 2,3-dioxygenase-like lactoylglutathione lyase family enzyme